MSNVNDRGTIKWTSMMMPEQVKMLDEYWNSMDNKIKPILDEQQLEEIGIKLHEAISKNSEVEITYYGDYDYLLVRDKIYYVNYNDKYLKMNDFDRTKIEFDYILDIQIE
ncbi:YolD-like family protein [Oceanobacillus sp. 143]|uniref:YolD-like family protein n=1 Tax=Oceanobacillus zhaokaii TaxID=2052660 RepID=A0A345PE75_9BACI|nr:YolD-like family protein [Oceanobacillus zhaokaii]AXI08305.1 YolD-like family protein [Oceanobacillus zhaokaii]QGS68226.1 YolD-like family protein [Oceanobacillus sp. 143]